MTDPVGFDFNETLDFLSVLQDSVPSLQERDEYVPGLLDLQLMFNENVDRSPDLTSPVGSNNYLFVNDSSPNSYEDPLQVSLMTDDASFLTEFSNIHKSEQMAKLHSPLTPHLSSKGLAYDSKPLFSTNSFVTPMVRTPQSNLGLRTKSPGDKTDSEEVKPEPKAVLPKQKISRAPKKLKILHNVIEKKYRTNINTKILELRDMVPSLRIRASSQNMLVADLEGLTPASKLNKASVLTKATEYIKHLETKHTALDNKIAALQNLINQSPTNSVERMPESREGGGDTRRNPLTSMSSGTQNNRDYYDELFNQYPEQLSLLQNCGVSNGNLFMGGFATLLGANCVSEDSFRGMAALPLFPRRMAISPSAQNLLMVKNFMMVLGIVCMVCAVYNFVASIMGRFFKKGTQFSLRSLNFQPLLDADKLYILANISGKRRATTRSLFRCYSLLITKEQNFENSFLLLLVCSLLKKKLALLSKPLTIAANLKTLDFKILSYSGGDEGLQNLRKLTSEDGLNMFHCAGMVSRLSNLADQKVINHNIQSGENSLYYVDVYLRHRNNIYSVIYGWRVLTIIYDLNLMFLDILATPQERREEKMAQFTADLTRLEGLLGKGSQMSTYLYGLQMTARPTEAPQVLCAINEELARKLTAVSQLFENQDLTDTEDSGSDSEEKGCEQEDYQDEEGCEASFEVIRKQKSLVSSLDLMNEEKFIAITSSLVLHLLQKKEDSEALRVLGFLKFTRERPLSLLSFTSLVQLFTQLIAEQKSLDDFDTDSVLVKLDTSTALALELLLKMMRAWLKDEGRAKYLSYDLRVDLTEIVVNRALILNRL